MKAEACFKLLGRYISFLIGKEEKLGRLIQIKIDAKERLVVGIDENGFIEEYESEMFKSLTIQAGKAT